MLKKILNIFLVIGLITGIVGCGSSDSGPLQEHKDSISGTQYTFDTISTNYKGAQKNTTSNFLPVFTVYADSLQYEMTQGNINAILSFYADQIEGDNGTVMNKTDMVTRLNQMKTAGYLPFVSFVYSNVTTTANADGTTISTCLLTATSGVDTTGTFSGTAGQAQSFSQWKETKMKYDATNDKWVIFSEININAPTNP